jgi:UDP-N-acetylglucosamine pyrophosphorylase
MKTDVEVGKTGNHGKLRILETRVLQGIRSSMQTVEKLKYREMNNTINKLNCMCKDRKRESRKSRKEERKNIKDIDTETIWNSFHFADICNL